MRGATDTEIGFVLPLAAGDDFIIILYQKEVYIYLVCCPIGLVLHNHALSKSGRALPFRTHSAYSGRAWCGIQEQKELWIRAGVYPALACGAVMTGPSFGLSARFFSF
jgi:hypothetical protein